jgi:hypothetical protein
MNFKNILTMALVVALLSPIPAFCHDNLLIIAPDVFIDELKPLKRFKDATVRPTILLSLTDIYNNNKYNNCRDNPERIKKCIADYEKSHGIQFVLLAGDCDMFPVRYCKAYNTEWGNKYYPSDLYYADLYDGSGGFDNWNGDNDSIIGEMDFSGKGDINKVNLDGINMYPDVAVARVPASTSSELTTYVNKIINYELKAPGSWFNKALLVVDGYDNHFGYETKMDGIVKYLNGFDIDEKKLYGNKSPWNTTSPDDRAKEINRILNNGVGFVSYYGHGTRHSWTTFKDGIWYDRSKLSNLTNHDMLPVIFATACYTGRFHFDREYYLRNDGSEWDRLNARKPATDYPEPMAVQSSLYDGYESESLAEHFLVKRNEGAIGYIGCVSKAEQGAWFDVDKGLCPYFFEHYQGAWFEYDKMLGRLWQKTLGKFINDEVVPEAMGQYRFIHIHKMMLFGDPSLMVGGAFRINRCGTVYDGEYTGGPLSTYSRCRIECDVTVPLGEKLTIYPHASILFDNGKKITAKATGLDEGLVMNGASDMPINFLSLAPEPQSEHAVQGMKLTGQLRIRNGGQIKLY